MEQNNFEKNVQQKMDELKIAPSESVWTNVEKQIGKKEKDRRGIFILFFLILFLLSGGYWWLNSTKNNLKKDQQLSNVIKTESNSKTTNKQDSSFLKSTITAENKYGNIDSASVSTRNVKSAEVYFQNEIKKDNQQKREELVKESGFKLKENYSKQINNEDSEIALNNVSELIEKKIETSEIENENKTDAISIQNLSNRLKTEKIIKKLIALNDSSSTKKTSKIQQRNRWIFGITFLGGASLIGNNILERNYPMADLNAGVPQSGGTPAYFYNPSPIKNSTAFIAGVLIEKNISSKTKISLGISYKYFSLINKVGNKIDSIFSSSQYFSSNNLYGSVNSYHLYRNNFHYLELPVAIKLQLNKNKKLPLWWDAGINISQLISSNALQFQSNPGLYYNSNSMFNKTQFGFHTGLSVMLFPKQKMPFTFGPYFYYSATSIADKGLYGEKHFSFIGLRTEILFQKK
jgi:hypothetical protein